ncbi:MAG: hypothetical protein E6J20_18520 [Chloroflexi bacterium]|nr:MAG: hypothetical protein E6J20_18520 [Chloroflexota bacterium]
MNTGMPVGIDLADGWRIRFTALTATTGVVDTSVVVSQASLLVDNLGGGDLSTGFTLGEIEWLNLPDNLVAPAGGG